MKSVSNLLVYVTLAAMAAGCYKSGKVPAGFLGLDAGNNTLVLEDDTTNLLLWNSAVDEIIVGNVLNPVINGSCRNVLQVELWVNGSVKKTSPCVLDKFQFSLSGADAFINGTHTLKINTVPASSSLDRTYKVLSVTPSSLVSLGSVPTSTLASSINFSLTCHSDLKLTIAGVALDCVDTEVKTESIPLVMGVNSFTVTWIDIYRNSGQQTFSLTRNPPGSVDITAGMISATGTNAISLSNCTGPCDGSTLSQAAIHGFSTGVTVQNIPLSRAPSSGGGGETISLGNQSYIFCEHQNVSGECIP